MSSETPGVSPRTASIIERAKNILLTPGAEWDRIEAEPATTKGIITGYVAIIAAIGPICYLIGSLLFGHCLFVVCWRPNPVSAVISAVVYYVLQVAAIFVTGLIIDAVAPNFGATKNPIQALKLAAYAATAACLGGVLFIIPQLGGLVYLVSIYSWYLLFLGMPKLMKAPEDKAIPFFVVGVIVFIILQNIAFYAPQTLTGFGRGGGFGGYASNDATISINNGNTHASINLGQMRQAADALSAATAKASANGQAAPGGAITPVATDVLSAMLPGSVAGYSRGNLSSSSTSAGAMSFAHVSAAYSKGPANFTLEVVDLGTASAIAKFGAAMNINSNEQTGTSYTKVNTVDGRMISERYDTANKSGSYGVVVAGRFSVKAEGTGADMSDLKSAVGAIDLGKLDSLSKH